MKYLNVLLLTSVISSQAAAQTIQFIFKHEEGVTSTHALLNVSAEKDNFFNSHRTKCLNIGPGQTCSGKVWSALGAPDPSGRYNIAFECEQFGQTSETVNKTIILLKTTKIVTIQASCPTQVGKILPPDDIDIKLFD
jgi:hypothetical protein